MPPPGTPSRVPPLPPSDTYSRRYNPPAAAALGRPNSDRGDSPASPAGRPVTLRPQPDTPPSGGVMPKVADGMSYVMNQTTPVDSWDVRTEVVRQGDTYATISQRLYGSDRYHDAVAAYLRDHDPNLTSLQANQRIKLPVAAEILEQKFPDRIVGGVPPRPASTRPNSSAPVSSAPGSAPVNPIMPAGQSTTGSSTRYAAGTAAGNVPSPNGPPHDAANTAGSKPATPGKTYRVGPEDATLWAVARKTLGNGNRWTDIYNLNADMLRMINNVPQIEPGMVLKLPADANVDSPPRPQ